MSDPAYVTVIADDDFWQDLKELTTSLQIEMGETLTYRLHILGPQFSHGSINN